MSVQVQHRRGTTAEHATFTGALGEVTMDTTKKALVVHDGLTAGGFVAAKGGANSDISSLNVLVSVNGGQIAGIRNRIINGDMRIDQRNNGVAATVASVYSLDRWKVQNSSNAGTVQRVTSTLPSFANSLKYIAAGANSYLQIGHQIEYANCYDLQSQNVTISFTAKANNANAGSTALVLRTRTIAGIDGAALLSGAQTDSNITLTTTPTKYSVTKAMGTFGALSLEFVLGAHIASDGFEISGVQIELGSVATPFEQRPIGMELSLCQRYYQTVSAGLGGYTANGCTNTYTSSLPVAMRAAPTVVVSNQGNTNTTGATIGATASSFSHTSVGAAAGAFLSSATATLTSEL